VQQADLSEVVAHTPNHTDISYVRSSDCAPKYSCRQPRAVMCLWTQ